MRANNIFLAATVVVGTFGLPEVGVSADNGASPATFRTATVTRGNLAATIAATGTIEPEEVVDVDAQVVGRIARFGADPHASGKLIDFGSLVEEGTLLAQIDDAMYAAKVEQARLGCVRADAELTQAKAKLGLAKAEWQRAQDQIKGKSISTSDLDVAKCTCEVAQASVAIAEATLAQSKVALKETEINLGYTSIRSPVKGVVINRSVNLGQTVGPNGNATGLFLIAKVKKLQLWVLVNEADIGVIREKQAVRFTVDAYPGKSFAGKVAQIRLNAAATQNVVNYTVVVALDNANDKLLPYLTANVQFEVGRRENVLRVPSAALRWRPQPQWIVPEVRENTSSGSQKPEGREANPGERTRQQASGRVWVRDGKFVRPVAVQVGLSDGSYTEIGGDNVQEGMEVIVGENAVDNTTNPFAPKILKGGGGR
jgi:HlyD family secretion protein